MTFSGWQVRFGLTEGLQEPRCLGCALGTAFCLRLSLPWQVDGARVSDGA